MAGPSRRSVSFVLALLAILTLASLAVFAWVGRSARLWADDFCYSTTVQAHPIPQDMLFWRETSGNRFATLLLVRLSDTVLGPYGPAWLPGITIALLVLASYLALRTLWPGAGKARWLAALVFVFFYVLMLPSLMQALFWRMGTLHYTFPIIPGLLLLSLVGWIWRGGQPRRPALWLAGATLLSFLAAGLSETYAAFQTGALLLTLGASFIFAQRAVRPVLLGSLLGSLAAMALMATAPANAWRQAELPPPDSLVDLLLYTLRFSYDFIRATLGSRPLPSLVLSATAFAFGALPVLPLRPRNLAATTRGLVLGGLLTFGLVACAIAPSVYAGLQYPAERAQSIALFALLSGLVAGAIWLGNAARSMLPAGVLPAGGLPARGLLGWLALALLLGASAYIPSSLDHPLSFEAGLQQRAQNWDARHAQLLAARAQGAHTVSVAAREIVDGLEDLHEEANFWVNACMAEYYGLESLVPTP